jgi:hypothetical protein
MAWRNRLRQKICAIEHVELPVTALPSCFVAPRTQRLQGMFEAPELLALVLSYLPLMDLLRYGDVCKATRCQVRMLLRTRVLHYTRPFFPSKTKLFDFAASLTRLQSWIVGSVPLAVLSLCADVAVPDNLNIICGHYAIDTSDGWHTFLVSNLGFHHVETTVCDGLYAVVGHSVSRFAHPAIPVRSDVYLAIRAS